MTVQSLNDAMETFYIALNGEEIEPIEAALSSLKVSMNAENVKEITVEPEKLPNNTREGRRMLKSFARKRGVSILFKK